MLSELKTEPFREKRTEETTVNIFNKVILPIKTAIVQEMSKEIKDTYIASILFGKT